MRKCICVGGPKDGWTGTILHGAKIWFPTENIKYQITDKVDVLGRHIYTPIKQDLK